MKKDDVNGEVDDSAMSEFDRLKEENRRLKRTLLQRFQDHFE